jgi:hypothetical protein
MSGVGAVGEVEFLGGRQSFRFLTHRLSIFPSPLNFSDTFCHTPKEMSTAASPTSRKTKHESADPPIEPEFAAKVKRQCQAICDKLEASAVEYEPARDDLTLVVAFGLPPPRRAPLLLFIRESTVEAVAAGTALSGPVPLLLPACVRAFFEKWFPHMFSGDCDPLPADSVLHTLLLLATDRAGNRLLPARTWLLAQLPPSSAAEFAPGVAAGRDHDATHYKLVREVIEHAISVGRLARPEGFVADPACAPAEPDGPTEPSTQAFRLLHLPDPALPAATPAPAGLYIELDDVPYRDLDRLMPGDRALLVRFRDCARFVTDEYVPAECKDDLEWLHSAEALRPENAARRVDALAKCAFVVPDIDHCASTLEDAAERIRFHMCKRFVAPDRAAAADAGDEDAADAFWSWAEGERRADVAERLTGYAVLWKVNKQMQRLQPSWIFESVSPCPGNAPFQLLESSCNAPVTQVLSFADGNELWATNEGYVPL